MNEIDGRVERSKVTRVICAMLWFIPVSIVVQAVVGGIVGATAGAGTQTFQAGYTAGQTASVNFFRQYGALVLLGELALTIALSVTGKLPGTGKWKNVQKMAA